MNQGKISDIIKVEHHYQPANGASECCLPSYLLSIHLGKPITLQRKIDGRRSSDYLVEGDIMITPPYLRRKLSWDTDAEFLLLRFESKFFSAIIQQFSDLECHITPQLKLCDPLIQNIGLALKSQIETDGLCNRLYAESMMNALVVHILHRYSSKKDEISNYSGGLPSHQLQKTIDYIQSHLSEDISLENIAAYVGISQYYFVRLFKQSTGYSPYQYLIKCRIERAKQLMMLRQGSITDIAVLVGFTSQSQFGRHFKRFTGITPKEFFKN
ncbi:AraC family transcriptional regulator [Calothrix sp. HK-06]|nr:AraC family transcriptional regulator [Calothrix sp. HK-06]